MDSDLNPNVAGSPVNGTPVTESPAPAPGQASGNEGHTGIADAGTTPPEGASTGASTPDSGSSFFDPSQVPPELQERFRGMQAAYTRKMQEISAHRAKVQAYDEFMRDPHTQVRILAQQLGYRINPVTGEAVPNGQPADTPPELAPDWVPNSWAEVAQRAKESAKAELMRELAPNLQQLQGQVRSMTAQKLEGELDRMDPEWRNHEADFARVLQSAPGLIRDLPTLYRAAMPPEALEKRAYEKAIRELTSKANAGRVQGKSSVAQTQQAAPRARSFQEAVDLAKQAVARGQAA